MKNIIKNPWLYGTLIFLILFAVATRGRHVGFVAVVLFLYGVYSYTKNKSKGMAIGTGIIIFYAILYSFMAVFI